MVTITNIYAFAAHKRLELPLFTCPVAAGFPSPAEDWIEQTLDLNDLLIKNPPATFLLRVSGDSMTEAGIVDGSILIVDRSISPKSGMIVVASVDGDLTVKRLAGPVDAMVLRAANPEYADIPITENTMIWGIVKSSVVTFDNAGPC